MKKYVGFLFVVGIGAGLFLTHVAHAVGEDENIWTFLLGIFFPMAAAVGVLVGGVILWQRDLEGEHFLRVGVWSTVGTIFLAIGGVLIILYQRQYGVVMDEQLFVVINGASGGALVGFVVGVYNTRQRRAQTRVDRANRQLTILNRVLRHDIRNKANVIRGNAGLLTRESVDTAAKAEQIEQHATHLVQLGEQARQIERVLNEERQSQQAVDIASVVASCCERIRRDYPRAAIESSLDSAQYVVAHQLIESAVANVIENAFEHNDKQTPHVTVASTVVSDEGTDYVELRIADDGPGIPETEIEALERGYETELQHSTGLGLWLVHWIIRNADGEIRFEENEPAGSVVCLRMKRARRSPPSSSASKAADTTTS